MVLDGNSSSCDCCVLLNPQLLDAIRGTPRLIRLITRANKKEVYAGCPTEGYAGGAWCKTLGDTDS